LLTELAIKLAPAPAVTKQSATNSASIHVGFQFFMLFPADVPPRGRCRSSLIAVVKTADFRELDHAAILRWLYGAGLR
jgi:hypothetical protein